MIYSIKTTISLWLASVLLLSSSPLHANGQGRLYLENIPLKDEKLLVVSISLAEVDDLYGAEIQVRYDPNQLQVRDSNPRLEGVQITPGPLLANDHRFVVRNMVETRAGLINFAVTFLNPAPAVSGEGTLATIFFKITGDGPFWVKVVKARLVSADAEVLPVTTEDFYLNGAPEPVAAPQPMISNLSSWQWREKTVLAASLLVIFALLVLLGTKWLPTAPASAHPAPRRIPGAGRSSIRSAALLTRQGNHVFEQGSSQQAYELFSRAIELDPANAEAWLGKGLVAQQSTEKRICFQRVLALDPDNPTASTELQQLESQPNSP